MRHKTIIGVLAALAVLSSPVTAKQCTIDAVPAATLLLPYFEVDVANPNGVDTFFSINNASAASVITHVVIWTDWSVEALDFSVFLTGYDVQTIGLGLIIRDGILPVTASEVSNVGANSDPTLPERYASCEQFLPYLTPALDEEYLAHIQSALTGGPSSIYDGFCSGHDYGDGIARGYVTVDQMEACTLLTPCDPGYFTDLYRAEDDFFTPRAGGYQNVLWGDWYMVNYAENFAQGDNLVHIESYDNLPEEGHTFYERCMYADDRREPLGSQYATRFFQNAAFSGGTDLFVWRDSRTQGQPWFCGAEPGWVPLREFEMVAFDEQENPETLCTVSPCIPVYEHFPFETQRVSVVDFGYSAQSGWLSLDLNQFNFLEDGSRWVVPSQAWVVAVHSAEGRFSAGLPAIQLDSLCNVNPEW